MTEIIGVFAIIGAMTSVRLVRRATAEWKRWSYERRARSGR